MTIFSRFLKDELGATAIEYGLIAALVGVALITALTAMEDDCRLCSRASATSSARQSKA